MNDRLLLEALVSPCSLAALDLAAWDRLLRQARHARLLARLAHLLQADEALFHGLPGPVRGQLAAGRVLADKHETTMRWEIYQVRRALAGLDAPVVLLKGAAYVAADLPPARGRLYNDIDLMVPRADLERAEARLREWGWEPLELHPYDERYYRRWMHELPPLVHARRRTVLDLHHTILPATGRLRPDPEKLFAAARPLPGDWLRVLAPADMVLHSAAHLFQDGDLSGGLRDLVDLDALLRHFAAEPGFWPALVPRGRELDLARPLHYALRYAQRFLQTPVPAGVLAQSAADGPGPLVRRAMDALVAGTLAPRDPDRPAAAGSWAGWCLYVRAHWLRMPPRLLLPHLARKTLRRWFPPDEPR